MSYNNFSDWYKKALVNSETNIKKIWLKELMVEDIFLEIVKNCQWTIKEIFSLYWVNSKIAIEIIDKAIFNEAPSKRTWVYSWMNSKLKDIILWSVKIAASFSKEKASIEDFLLSMLKNDSWLPSFLDYIWIVPSDLETNINDINKLWTIDWLNDGKKWEIQAEWWTEQIDKLLWALTQNLLWWLWDFLKTSHPQDEGYWGFKDVWNLV